MHSLKPRSTRAVAGLVSLPLSLSLSITHPAFTNGNIAKIYDACDTVNSCSTPKHISNVWHDFGQRQPEGKGCFTCRWHPTPIHNYLSPTPTPTCSLLSLLPVLLLPCFSCSQANNNVKYVRRFAIHTQKWMSGAFESQCGMVCGSGLARSVLFWSVQLSSALVWSGKATVAAAT